MSSDTDSDLLHNVGLIDLKLDKANDTLCTVALKRAFGLYVGAADTHWKPY